MRLAPTRAALGATLSLALLASAAVTAGAQEAPASPSPVLVSAPAKVGFGKTATIVGRLDDGVPGDEVNLQARRAGKEWSTMASKPVDENLRVRFVRKDLRRSTNFRLMYTDEFTGVDEYSDTARVVVRSLLTSNLSTQHTFVGRTVSLKGLLRPIVPGRRIVIQQKLGGEWGFLDKVQVDQHGQYRSRFTAKNHGQRPIRAVFRGDASSARETAARVMNVYRQDLATWYGPGFYGNRTACGKTLTTSTLGVAHRSLPCGTSVSILFKGRTITVPVIDRGPFTSADWDLTGETARRLRFSGKEHIGVTY